MVGFYNENYFYIKIFRVFIFLFFWGRKIMFRSFKYKEKIGFEILLLFLLCWCCFIIFKEIKLINIFKEINLNDKRCCKIVILFGYVIRLEVNFFFRIFLM